MTSYANHPGVDLARAYLDEHATERVSLAELARHAGLSPFWLAHRFTEQVGMPPHLYQTRLRITVAQDLLRQGQRPAEVAVATGFSDQAHLTRTFLAILGTTPARFAATCSAGDGPQEPSPASAAARNAAAS